MTEPARCSEQSEIKIVVELLQADQREHHDSVVPSPHGVRKNSAKYRSNVNPETVELIATVGFWCMINCKKSITVPGRIRSG